MDSGSSSFPRGSNAKSFGDNGTKKRPLNTKDELFSSNKRMKKMEVVTKKKAPSKDDRMLPSIGLGVSASKKDITKIKLIQKDDIKTGVMFLGFVLQIEEKSAVISAPNGHTAILHVQDLSDVIHDIWAKRNADESNLSHQEIPDLRHLLELHQPIRCCVLPMNEQRGRLQVSCRASLINRGLALKHLLKGFLLNGCVSSIEDHGYIISVGMPDVNFFLPRRANEAISLLVGQSVDCIVEEVNTESRTVTVLQRKNNYHDAPLATKSLPFLALSPGMLFEVLVDKKVPTGYIVNYLSLFHGVIDRYSTYKICSDAEWEELGNKQNTLLARIVFIDHASKTVRLSCRPHILSLRKPMFLPALGSTLEHGSVIMRSKMGAFLRVGQPAEAQAEEEESIAANVDGRIKKKQRKQIEEDANKKAEQSMVNVIVKATELADIGVSDTATEADNDEDEEDSDDSEDSDNVKGKHSKSDADAPIKRHKIHNAYTIGREVSAARVLGFRLVEGIVVASNLKKYVGSGSQQNGTSVMHASNIQIGQTLAAEVTQVTADGLILTIASRISAFCPVAHTSDSATAETKLSKKFSTGQKLTVRVLNKSKKGRVIVTHKKSLLELADEAIFQDYAHIPERQESTAVIESIDNEKGVGLRFFGDVHGVLPVAVLMKQGVLNIQEAYRVGQLVRIITLTTIHPTAVSETEKTNKKKSKKDQVAKQGKIICALAFVLNEEKLLELFHAISPFLPTEKDAAVPAAEETSFKNSDFEFVSGAVMGITEDSLLVRLDGGRTASLPKVHCHDFAFAAASLNIRDKAHYPYKVGQRIENALVLGTVKKYLLLTLKPLLLKAARGDLGEDVIFPSEGSGMSQGSICVGYVKKVDDFGVIVAFRGKIAALIPRANLADRFVSAEERLFAEGDSVRCVVQKVDTASERYILSTKASLVPKSGSAHRYFQAFLHDKYVATQRLLVSQGETLPDWRVSRIGTVIKATVTSVDDDKVEYLAADQTTKLIDRHFPQESLLRVGQTVDVLVLDVVYEANALLVKALLQAEEISAYNSAQNAPAKGKGKNKSKATAAAMVGVSQEVTILSVTEQYLVVTDGQLVGYAPIADFHATHPDVASFQVGDKVSATLQSLAAATTASTSYPHEEVNIFSLNQDPLAFVTTSSTNKNAKDKKSKAKKDAAVPVVTAQEGDLIEGTIDLYKSYSLEPPAIRVRFNNGQVGRLCFTEVADVKQWEDYADLVSLWRQHHDTEDVHLSDNEDDEAEGMLAEKKEKIEEALRRLKKKTIQHGKTVQVRVLAVNGHRIDVSTRPSRLNTEKVAQQTKADAMPTVGEIVKAYIHNVTSKGCFVRLSYTTKGRSLIKDLSDNFVENPEESFPTGMLVTCRVNNVDLLTGNVGVVLKDSAVRAAEINKKAIAKLRVGMTVKGTVENVKDIGVFVRIANTQIVGLARAVAALQDQSKTLQEEYASGDVVRAKVLKVSPKSQRVALGLREKYFQKDYELEDIYKNDSEEEDESDSEEVVKEELEQVEDDEDMDVDEDEEDDDKNALDVDEDEEEDDDDEEEESDEEEEMTKSKKKSTVKAIDYDSDDVGEAISAVSNKKKATIATKKATAVPVSKSKKRKHSDSDDENSSTNDDEEDDELGELDWGDNNNNVSDKQANKKAKLSNKKQAQEEAEESESDFGESDGSDDENEDKHKKSSKKKDSERKKHEKELRERELALAEGRLLPDSVNDFERLIIGQPNSSFLWIQYIAFHVKNADIDAARVIANRALRTIHFREEDEKFNVWVALLNMEYRYGSRESFERALIQAVNESKGKMIFLSLASSMEQAKDFAGAESLFEKALKRPQFRKSKKVWMAYHALKLNQQDINGAKAQLSRALQALAPHKHVEVIRHFAMLEFDNGAVDRGRVLMEELLSSYPKRNDLWNVYVDKEVKMGNVVQARQLFERMIALKVSPKVMKTVFKKYLLFENKYGDERSQELVKQKAREYVSSIA